MNFLCAVCADALIPSAVTTAGVTVNSGPLVHANRNRDDHRPLPIVAETGGAS